MEKNIRKVTWNNKILKNKSKDRDSNFLVMFSSSKIQRPIEKREGMAHWCWPQIHDDTWNVLNMQHIIPNSKSWDYSDIPGGLVATKRLKITGPTHMAECEGWKEGGEFKTWPTVKPLI